MSKILSTELASLTKQKFHSRSIGLPIEWLNKDICPPDAFTQVERSARANPSDTLFQEPTLNKYHTDSARVTGTIFEEYIDGICAALSSAVSMWMRVASVMAMTTAGPVGTLMPGGVAGPELEPFILAEAPKATPMERQYSRAIARAVSEAWNGWQIGLSGILQYPGFMGAPMPNSPAPLISLASVGEIKLAPQNLSRAMRHHFNEPDFLHSQDLFASVSEAFYTRFQEFKTNTIVNGVIAAGSSASGQVVPTPGNFV
jgi:hypothetical protein